MNNKQALIMETRKLISILSTWGNVLVPSIPGQTETHAQDKLEYCVKELESKYQLSVNDVDKKLQLINARMDGDFDNPALMEFGLLTSDTNADVLRIIES